MPKKKDISKAELNPKYKDYYQDKEEITAYVNFKLLDRNGKLIPEKDFINNPCFSAITYRGLPEATESVIIYHAKKAVPYDVDAIERWISDINEMGFPCAFIGENNRHYNFQINISDFKYKSHFISALMLVRALFEKGICKVPDNYFKIVDADPAVDKFDAMQTAHKGKLGGGVYGGGNTNHMVTFSGNGENVTKELLFGRYIKCGKDPKYNHNYPISQSDKWRGEAKKRIVVKKKLKIE